MHRFTLLVTSICASAAFAASPSVPNAYSLTVAELVKRGQRTAQLIASGEGSISWTTNLSVPGGMAEVTTLVAKGKSKRSLHIVDKDGTHTEVLSVIDHNNAWYVRENGKPLGCYRPFEAPLTIPNAYVLLKAANLHLIEQDMPATIESVDGKQAILKAGLTAERRARLEKALHEMEEFTKKMDDSPKREDFQAKMALLEQALEDHLLTVDVENGFFIETSVDNISCEVVSFSRNPRVSAETFELGTEAWTSFLDDPTRNTDLNDLLVISNSPLATPSNAPKLKGALDLRLVDLKTKRMRRVPFRGGSAVAGCFGRDRTRLYVSGMDEDNGAMALFEINLSTGENQRIVADGLPNGIALAPALSPDGKKLVLLMMSMNLIAQMYVVDLEAKTASKLGTPMDTAFFSWLKDNKGLILISRQYVSMDKPSEDSVARIDLDGHVTVLIKGVHPVLIPHENRILCEQEDEWKTCDTDGKDLKLYAGGMKGFGFPEPSPDGKRIAWMRFQKGRLPEPVLQEYGEEKVSELNLGPGLWAAPVWR